MIGNDDVALEEVAAVLAIEFNHGLVGCRTNLI
jgi:hypothetical protein